MNMRTEIFTPRWERVFQAEGRANARPRGRNKLRALQGDRKKACATEDEAHVGNERRGVGAYKAS